ncbi:MAG: class I SAM-dependent methyltransferase [Chlorobi bacterium]|nr:class I SAM-dependent methyltransferase [Chlorobiota bacterium]
MTCRICNSEDNHTVYHLREMMYGTREEFEYFECSQCGCLQIAGFPEDMLHHYPGAYYSFRKYDGRKFRGIAGRFRRKIYESFICRKTLIQKILFILFSDHFFYFLYTVQINKMSRVLDVGCGNGHKYLYTMTEAGFENVAGCDPFIPGDIHYDNGLTIRKSGISGISGKWDIIMYHHAFEHVPDPLKNLQKVHDLLDDDGVCIIRIPTVSSVAWEKYRENWFQADAPRHLFLYSVESMKILAQQAGFRVGKVLYDSTYKQFTESEKYVRGISLTTPEPKGFFCYFRRKWRKIPLRRLARKLNREGRGDQAVFYFVKRNDKSSEQ